MERQPHGGAGQMKLLGLVIGSMAMLASTAFAAEYRLKLAHEVAVGSTQDMAAKTVRRAGQGTHRRQCRGHPSLRTAASAPPSRR